MSKKCDAAFIEAPHLSLAQSLNRRFPLTSVEIDALSELPYQLQNIKRRATIYRSDVQSTDCCLLLSGLACKTRYTGSGGRQILSLSFPGELVDLDRIYRKKTANDCETITASIVAYISISAIDALITSYPNITRALWSQTLRDATIAAEWAFNISRHTALRRICHFICETVWRQQEQNLPNSAELNLAITQLDIADATGLTAVHVNRMIRQLDHDALIRLTEGKFRVIDMAGLKKVAEFDEGYLRD